MMSDGRSAFEKAFEQARRCACHGKSQPGRIRARRCPQQLGGRLRIGPRRAKFGVWHKFGAEHVQRYVDEVAFRWSNLSTKEGHLQEGQSPERLHPARTGREADHGPGQGQHRPAHRPGPRLQLQKSFHRPSHWWPDKPKVHLSKVYLSVDCAKIGHTEHA